MALLCGVGSESVADVGVYGWSGGADFGAVGAVEVEVGFGVAGDGEPVGGSEVVGLAAVTRS